MLSTTTAIDIAFRRGYQARVKEESDNNSSLKTQISDKLQELRHHRSSGEATTTDVIRVLEIMEALLKERP